MVKIKGNLLLEGLIGALNKQMVIKQYGKTTVISAYPDMSRVVKTEKQKKENSRFREAMAYAKQQMADPVSKAEYKAKAKDLQKPHNVAIADFYHPPEVKSIDASACKGNVGDLLIVHATDDFKVVKVTVEISINGQLSETGDAVQKSKWKWAYTLQHEYIPSSAISITARAWDKPGNMAEMTMNLSLIV